MVVTELNSDASCKSKDDYKQDFEVLQGTGTNIVRTYAAVDGGSPVAKCYILGDLLQAAQEFSAGRETPMQVLIGLWYALVTAEPSSASKG